MWAQLGKSDSETVSLSTLDWISSNHVSQSLASFLRFRSWPRIPRNTSLGMLHV